LWPGRPARTLGGMKKRLALHWKIVIGLVLGLLAGVLIDRLWTAQTWAALGVGDSAAFMARKAGEAFASGRPADANAEAGLAAGAVRFLVNANTFIGQLFFRALRFIAVPIVLCSLIVGVASLGDLRRLGRIGAKTLGIFLATTVISIVIGLALVNTVKPGTYIDAAARERMMEQHRTAAAASIGRTGELPGPWQQALDMVPANPFEALAKAQMLQVIVVAILIGMGLTMIRREKADAAVKFFDAITEAIVQLVNLVIRMAPVAVFALVAPAIVTMGLDVIGALLAYSLVLGGGLAIILLVEYPIVLKVLSGMGPGRFFKGLSPAILTAFSSSSSSATLPVTMECTRDRLGVSERITSFVCPLGATINMAGTSMYMGVAALFVAQMYGIELTVSQQASIVLMGTLAAVGTPGIPGAGVIMLVVVMQQVHVPPEGIAVILGVDRLLDMCRTVVNIAGDSMTAVCVAASEGELAPDRPQPG
jgi:proton glutamate symport protein